VLTQPTVPGPVASALAEGCVGEVVSKSQ
jgi:hypothetical protein